MAFIIQEVLGQKCNPATNEVTSHAIRHIRHARS